MSLPLSETSNHSDLNLSMSRRTLLVAGGLAAVALALPAFPARADFGYGDVKTLRFLEEVARLQADFFQKAAMSAPADALPEREANTINLIARQDAEVMRWFGSARAKYGVSAFDGPSTLNQASSRPLPNYRFSGEPFQNRDRIMARAIEIKTLALGAFHGAVGSSKDPKLIQAFAALGGVQGRHLAMLSELSGQTPFVAFESALSGADVAAQLAPYGFNAEVLG